MKKLILPIMWLTGLALLSWADLSNKIEYKSITIEELNALKERLIISEALVKKCTENDTIDIMQYVRDVKNEIEVEFERD